MKPTNDMSTGPTEPGPAQLRSAGAATATEDAPTIDLTVFDGQIPVAPPAKTPVHPLVSLLAIATMIFLAVSAGQLWVLFAVFAFAGMIFLHELGHYLTARLTNTKATEFFIGFGPRLWSFKRGETEYGIKAIPLGGYVKILGMNNLEKGVAADDEARTFRQASYPRRVLMAAAGTGMQLILAFVLFMTLFAGTGRFVDQTEMSPPVLTVAADGPANAGGLESGDLVVAMNGRPVTTFAEVRDVIQRNADTPVVFQVKRNGTFLTTSVTPVSRGENIFINVSLARQIERDSIPAAFSRSVKTIGNLVPQTFVSLKSFFAPSNLKSYADTLAAPPKSDVDRAQSAADTNRMLSPVGAANLLGDAAGANIRLFLEIFASINVFVGIFNMLPILPLDGGHILIATYERLRSRPKRGIRHRVDFAKWLPVTYAVMAVMLTLSLSSLYLDIRSPINIF